MTTARMHSVHYQITHILVISINLSFTLIDSIRFTRSYHGEVTADGSISLAHESSGLIEGKYSLNSLHRSVT